MTELLLDRETLIQLSTQPWAQRFAALRMVAEMDRMARPGCRTCGTVSPRGESFSRDLFFRAVTSGQFIQQVGDLKRQLGVDVLIVPTPEGQVRY